MRNQNTVLVTRFFGSKLLPFLVVALNSLQAHEDDASITVLVSDLNQTVEDDLKTAFPRVTFTRVSDVSIGSKWGHPELASSKLQTVYPFVRDSVQEGDHCFLFDSDLMFIGPVTHLVDQSWDLLFTLRSGPWPLNAGFVGIRKSDVANAYLADVTAQNVKILKSRSKSVKSNRLYGGPEQHAFVKPLTKRNIRLESHDPSEHVRAESSDGLRVLSVPCKKYNESDATLLGSDSRVIHFKSGWQNLILGEGEFTTKRPEHLAIPLAAEFMGHLESVLARAKGTELSRLLNEPKYLNLT